MAFSYTYIFIRYFLLLCHTLFYLLVIEWSVLRRENENSKRVNEFLHDLNSLSDHFLQCVLSAWLIPILTWFLASYNTVQLKNRNWISVFRLLQRVSLKSICYENFNHLVPFCLLWARQCRRNLSPYGKTFTCHQYRLYHRKTVPINDWSLVHDGRAVKLIKHLTLSEAES